MWIFSTPKTYSEMVEKYQNPFLLYLCSDFMYCLARTRIFACFWKVSLLARNMKCLALN